MLEEEARRFTGREVGEESPHELGRWLSTQLWGVDDPVELLQHVGGVLPDELGLESLVWVRQVISFLQDVLKLSHCRLLYSWEGEIKLQVRIHHVQPMKRGFC